MGEGVAKFHKGVAESHKRKPWWKRVTKTYKETMGEGCRNSEGGMRLPFKYLEFKDIHHLRCALLILCSH